MRITAVILGILGGLMAAFLGIKWLSDANEMREMIQAIQSAGGDTSEIDSIVNGGYCLIAALVFGIAGAVAVLKDKGKVAGALMLVGALLPAVFAPKALVFTFLLLLGGIFAFLAQPKTRAFGG